MTTTQVDTIATRLSGLISGEVETGIRRRAEYATDASNYRVVPQIVAFPSSSDDIVTAQNFAREEGIPLTIRGGGTSIAGNSIGTGLVLDLSRHLTNVISVDPEARTARVQPGTILTTLQKEAARHGLRFGPDPSTSNRATIGGMIGNNACGPHAVAWGKTAENVISLDVIDGLGRRYTAEKGSSVAGLTELVDSHLAQIRTHSGRFSRQVSGYSLEHLLPENGRDLAKFLVGSEGTLATVLEAEVALVPLASGTTLIVLGYEDMIRAADAVPAILPLKPLAIEGLDRRLVDIVERARGGVPELPAGGGWLMVEVGAFEGESPDIVADRVQSVLAVAGTTSYRIAPQGPESAALWKIRADGAGLGGRSPRGREAWPGWEDSAVPPEHLGAYLRDMTAVMSDHGVDGILYGHFGDGCVHVRIDMPLSDPSGVPKTRAFLEDAADLVTSYGGSLSGEHGDGRARSELLSRMYSPEMMTLFSHVKNLFDPGKTLNPGIIVDPDPLDANLRRPYARPIPGGGTTGTGFAFSEDGGDFTTAVHRCTGVGACRADTRANGGFMCPSYQATKDEKDVTRGRARILEEVANGQLIADWGSEEVFQSLDLCLACKACSADCPSGVDVARYKSEVLYRAHKGKIRPKLHYLLGQLPRWTKLATLVPTVAKLANAAMSVAPVKKTVFALAGVDTERTMPSLATRRFSRWASAAGLSSSAGNHAAKYVMLWADSFSETLDTDGARAMVEVLERAGYTVLVPKKPVCCGLTWITTGQLDGARHQLEGLLAELAPFAMNGIPIVGVEPSCTAVLRDDLPELLSEDPRSRLVADNTYTLAEILLAPAPLGPDRLVLPDLTGTTVVAQPHCHHYSVMGWKTDAELLSRTGADVVELSGCCGMAGNFGMERGHADISRKVAEGALLPALRDHPHAVFLADGFSCRTQAESLADRHGVHLATLLSGGLPES
ncbi:FAD-binding and (Fe-S)-binding domain-containing protein [Flaviflexus equikiangi]|uniref:FAD-binding and (Fe-S)-binding domain-containing protein n=1 Tax=Flaviflexus equikiangi TaxID=2758573 RepID=UPI0015F3D6AF|nr:FAD-binding and (Fe-S)-binding domain-containing protein [Flaviflexus equikiangi]